MQQNSKGKFCEKRDETDNPIVREWLKLAQKKKKKDWTRLGKEGDPLGIVQETEIFTFYQIGQTDHLISAGRTDLVLSNKIKDQVILWIFRLGVPKAENNWNPTNVEILKTWKRFKNKRRRIRMRITLQLGRLKWSQKAWKKELRHLKLDVESRSQHYKDWIEYLEESFRLGRLSVIQTTIEDNNKLWCENLTRSKIMTIISQ